MLPNFICSLFLSLLKVFFNLLIKRLNGKSTGRLKLDKINIKKARTFPFPPLQRTTPDENQMFRNKRIPCNYAYISFF